MNPPTHGHAPTADADGFPEGSCPSDNAGPEIPDVMMDPEGLVAEVGARLRARGERMTQPRRAVLTVLARHGGHLSAEDVVTAVAAIDGSVHRASVYRTLEALSELGAVQHLHVGHGGTAYHLVLGPGPHLHAQCRACGAVHDLPGDLLDDVAVVLSQRHRFLLDAGHVALSGVCATCAER